MQFEYRLSLKDYQEANQAYLKTQSLLYFLFWLFVFMGLLKFLVFINHGGNLGDIFTVIFALSFPLLFFNPYFSNPLQRFLSSRTWKDLIELNHLITIEANEEILKITTFNSENTFQWQIYIKAIETKNLFMLYQAKTLFHLIPKRAFSRDEQVKEFRLLLSTKIGKLQNV